MQKSYTFNYLKIYLWQGVSIALSFIALFIVMPRLTNNPTIYGIYVVCISANLFLSYGDIGFVNAGFKYASECFAQQNLEEEIRIIGFVSFILFLLVALFAVVISVIALNPALLIKNIHTSIEIRTASQLLFTLAFFSPVIMFQRTFNIIYGIRLEQFILHRIMIGASILKILSVFYFFQDTRYDIVGYFLFCQMITAVALIFCAIIAKVRYHYSFFNFIKTFRFSKPMFKKTKSLAFGSFFLTMGWIMFYELDAFAIAKLIGPESVAIYAVAFALLTFLRTLFGIVFGPFPARFNHFVALNDMDGLKKMYINIIVLTLPLVLFPILSLFLLMGPLINSWVGSQYQNSVNIAKLLILCFIYLFFSSPASFLIMAQERLKILYIVAILDPIIYWTGIVLTIHFLGLTSFALFKFVAMSVTGLFYFYITLKFLEMPLVVFVKTILWPVIVPLVLLILSLSLLSEFIPAEKSSFNLFVVILTGGLTSAGALFLYYLLSNHFKKHVHAILRKCFA